MPREGHIARALAKALPALRHYFPTAVTMAVMPAVMQQQPAVADAVTVITTITTIKIITQLRSLRPLLLSALPFRLFAGSWLCSPWSPSPCAVEGPELWVVSTPRISTPCLPLDPNSQSVAGAAKLLTLCFLQQGLTCTSRAFSHPKGWWGPWGPGPTEHGARHVP